MLSRPQQILLHLYGHLWIYDIAFSHVQFHQHIMLAGRCALLETKISLMLPYVDCYVQSCLTGTKLNILYTYTFQLSGICAVSSSVSNVSVKTNRSFLENHTITMQL